MRRRVKRIRRKWMGWSRKIRRKSGKKIINISQSEEEGEAEGGEEIEEKK